MFPGHCSKPCESGRLHSLHLESARVHAAVGPVVSLSRPCLCGGLRHGARIEERSCRDVQEGAADQDHFPVRVSEGDVLGASWDTPRL